MSDKMEVIEDSLDLVDMLYLFGHAALGLSIQEAIEIDPHYRRRLEYENVR